MRVCTATCIFSCLEPKVNLIESGSALFKRFSIVLVVCVLWLHGTLTFYIIKFSWHIRKLHSSKPTLLINYIVSVFKHEDFSPLCGNPDRGSEVRDSRQIQRLDSENSQWLQTKTRRIEHQRTGMFKSFLLCKLSMLMFEWEQEIPQEMCKFSSKLDSHAYSGMKSDRPIWKAVTVWVVWWAADSYNVGRNGRVRRGTTCTPSLMFSNGLC